VSELTLTLLRLGLLVMLWLFVFAVVGVLRNDLYGTRVSRRRERSAAKAQQAAQRRAAAAAAAGNAAPAPAPAAVPAGMPSGRPAPASPPAQPGPGGAGRARGGRGIPTSVVVTEGRLAGTVIPLTASAMLIGRNPECALVLEDDFASGRHARIFHRDGGWWVEDLGSTNGTFLGGAKLTTVQPLTIGSALRIGRTVLELQG